MSNEKKDARDHLVDAWLADLENGVAPWAKPWKCSGPCGRPRNFESKRAYTGLNVFTLLWAATEGGFTSNEWLTFSGVKRLEAQVKKGEHGTWILQPVPAHFWRTVEDPDTGEKVKERVDYWRFKGLKVFNVEQTTIELPKPEEETEEEKAARIQDAEAFIQAQGAKLHHGGDRAFYRPSTDSITLPPFEAFQDAASYYSTSLHEHAHWTGHESRLGRDLSGWFGNEDYAFEELVAEMASAYLCLDLGIEGKLQHREYIGSWAKHITENRDAIFRASKLAEQAAAWMHENTEKATTKAAA